MLKKYIIYIVYIINDVVLVKAPASVSATVVHNTVLEHKCGDVELSPGCLLQYL